MIITRSEAVDPIPGIGSETNHGCPDLDQSVPAPSPPLMIFGTIPPPATSKTWQLLSVGEFGFDPGGRRSPELYGPEPPPSYTLFSKVICVSAQVMTRSLATAWLTAPKKSEISAAPISAFSLSIVPPPLPDRVMA